MPLDRAKVAQNAEKYLKAGKVAEAIAEFKKLAEDSPRDMNVYNKLGDLCVRAGKTQDAMRYFLRIAEFYAADGFFLKAIAMYKKVSKLDPSNMDCLQRLAGLYQQQGLTIEAKAQYQAVLDQFLKAGQVKKALETYPKMLSVEPDNMKARLQYAELLVRAGMTGEACREYRFVAKELAKRGMLDEAIQVARKGAKAVPGNADMMSLVLSLSKEAEKAPADLLASVEQMARTNGDNPRSLALLGEAYLAAGRSADADKVFRRLEGMADGAPPEVAAAVGRYHAARNDADRSFEWIVRAADEYASSDRVVDGLNLIAELLRAFPDSRPALARQASLAEQAGRKDTQVEALARLAQLHAEAGEASEATEIAAQLQALDPNNPRHARLLASLRGGGARPEMAPGTGTAPARPSPPVPDIQEGALELDDTPAVTAASDGGDAAGPVGEEQEAEEGETELEGYGADSRIQEMEESEEDEEDEDFINEHFTEAEVFIKYGLLEKAKEQLHKILARYPKHVPSHTKLKEIFYEEGDKDRAVGACLMLAEIHRGRGRRTQAQEMVNEAIKIDPNNPRVKEIAAGSGGTPAAGRKGAAPAAPPRPAPAPAAAGPSRAADVPAPRPAAPARPAAKTPPKPEPVIEEEPMLEIVEEPAEPGPASGGAAPPEAGDALEIEIDVPEAPAGPAAARPTAAAPPSATTGRKMPERVEEETPDDLLGGLGFGEDGDEITIDMGDSGAAGEAAPQAFAGPGQDPDAEKLGEVDFYIDQGLFEEARAVLFQLQKQYPGSQEVTRRFERANRPASEAPPARPAPPAGEPSALDLDVERAFGSQTIAIPSPASGATPRASKATPVFKVEKTAATAEAEGDFFDLAGELDRSLAEAQVAVQTAEPDLPEGQHSLDEIFRAFRRGVEQQVDSQDYETHYNLGIAYKEMGLVDEAIGEFQYAAKDPARTVECCGILGLCFREKGMHQLALKWYQKALEMPGIGEHEAIGLRYDMAEVYRDQGDAQRALQLYTEVYGIDSTYRDVAAKIKEMKKLLS